MSLFAELSRRNVIRIAGFYLVAAWLVVPHGIEAGRWLAAGDDPARIAEFRELMLTEGRSGRLRHGALSWELLHDLEDPGRFLELVTDESWTDHLRRFERVTTADAELHARKQAFHLGPEPPLTRRYVADRPPPEARG